MSASELGQWLDSSDAEVRREAVAALAELGGDEAVELLLRALGDADWRVRQEAIRAGVVLSASTALPGRLVGALCQGDNVGLRNAALELLGTLGPAALDPLVGALGEVAEGDRKFVIEALARVGDARATEALVGLLEDGDSIVVTAAIEALAAMGGAQAERALVAQLAGGDALTRMAAMDALNRVGARVEYEALASLLGDRLVRRLALVALGRSADLRAVAPLVAALEDSSRRVREAAAEALSRLRAVAACREEVARALREAGPAAREALLSLAGAGSVRHRQAAVELLSVARDAGALSLIARFGPRESLDESGFDALSAWGVDAADRLLDRLGEQESPDASLLELISDLLTAVRSAQPEAAGLGELSEVLRTRLRGALHGTHVELVAAAARCLVDWGEAEDAPRLASLAASAGAEVAATCAAALERLAGSEAAAVAEALLGVNLDGPGGAELTPLVAQLGGDLAFDRLHTALLARSEATRCAAIRGIARIGGPRAAELVALSLTDESEEVQAVAAEALGRVRDASGHPVGVESLLLALDSGQTGVRAAAARALGRAGDPRAAPALRRHVRGERAAVVIAALEALRDLGETPADDVLVDMLGHEDPEVVKQALVGLGDSEDERAVARLAIGLEHTDWAVRRLAAAELVRRGGGEAARALRARLVVERDDLVLAVLEEGLSALGDGTA